MGELRRTLTLWHVVFLGLAFMSPFAVFDVFGIVTAVSGGHVPTAYIVVALSILFTALSYGKMVRVYPFAGSAYTYTRRTMASGLGFLVGWAALLQFLFYPMINALLADIYLSSMFPDMPSWVWVVGLITIITIMSIAGVKISVSANNLMVIFQILIVAIFVILTVRAIITGDTGQFSIQPFFSSSMTIPAVFAGAALCAFGFESVATLAEDTIDPKKNIPRGIVLVVVIGGLFFVTVTYFMQSLFPDVASIQSITDDIEGASPAIAHYIGGIFFQSVFLAGAVVSVIASGLSGQISGSRLVYAMGRDGVFFSKKFFGYIHPRLKTPVNSILFTGILALTAVLLTLDTALSLLNFGAFTAATFVNLSVIFYYFKKLKTRTIKMIIGYIVFPVLGLAMNIYLWFSLDVRAMVMGLLWVALGFVYLLYLTRFFTKETPEFDFDVTSKT